MRIRQGPVRLFADLLRVDVPSALNAVQTNLAPTLVTAAIGLFGVKAIAGYGIASRLDYLMIPIVVGLATAALTMVGITDGGGDASRAKRIAWTAGLAGAGLTESIGLVVGLFRAVRTSLFTHDTEEA